MKFLMLQDYLLILPPIQKLEKLKKIPGHAKYITSNEFKKFSDAIIYERLKKAELTTTTYHNTVKQLATKNKRELEN